MNVRYFVRFRERVVPKLRIALALTDDLCDNLLQVEGVRDRLLSYFRLKDLWAELRLDQYVEHGFIPEPERYLKKEKRPLPPGEKPRLRLPDFS